MTIGAIVAAVSLLVAAVLGWLLVGVGLRPLREVEETALAIASGGDLDHEVPGENSQTEVGRLAAALNTMLRRIRGAFSERDAKERALEESEARMRRFVADVSHELRTPLAAVTAYTELFERGARDRPEDLERALRGISLEASRMGELVEELLLLAHLDEGRPLERRRIDVVEVVVDAVAAARAVSPDWPITLRVTDVVTIEGDASRLRQVLDNLLSNVRTHTPAGTSTSVEVGIHDQHATIVVADNGPGMTSEQSATGVRTVLPRRPVAFTTVGRSWSWDGNRSCARDRPRRRHRAGDLTRSRGSNHGVTAALDTERCPARH